MPHRILALDLGPQSVRAAAVESTFRDFRISGVYRGLGDGRRALADQLRELLAQLPASPDTVLVALPSELVTQRVLRLPFRDRKKLDQTVPFELETQVPFGLDEIVVDYHIVARDRSGATVLAAMVQKRDLRECLDTLSAVGLDPKVVDFGPLCSVNLLRLYGASLPATYAYVELTHRELAVALFRDGHLVGVRSLLLAPRLSANGAAPPVPTVTDALVQELRWTLAVLNEAPIPEKFPCVLAAEAGEFVTEATRVFSQSLGVEVKRLESLPGRPLAGLDNGAIPAYARPLGLALREVTPATSVGVNFRKGEFTYHQARVEMRRSLVRIGILASVVLTLVLSNLFVQHRLEQARLNAIDARIREVLANTIPDLQPGSNPVAQLQAEIDAAQRKLVFLANAAPVGNLTAIDLLYAITNAIPPQVKVDTDEFSMDPDSVRIRGVTESFESVDALKKQLAGVKYFRDVQVKDTKARPGGGVEFRLTLALAKPGQENNP